MEMVLPHSKDSIKDESRKVVTTVKCSAVVAAIIGGVIITAIIAQGRPLTMPSLTFFSFISPSLYQTPTAITNNLVILTNIYSNFLCAQFFCACVLSVRHKREVTPGFQVPAL